MPRPRIMVVDDNDGIRTGIRLYFEACGYDVVAAADCATATRLLEAGPLQVVLLDYSLPDGTALELLASIATAQPQASVVVLTADPSASLPGESRAARATLLLLKPVELAYLRGLVDQLLASQTAAD